MREILLTSSKERCGTARTTAMKKAYLCFALLTLSLGVACSNGTNVPPGNGNFSVSSLKGQYVYQIAGTDVGAGQPYRQTGVFSADGSGHITTETDDFCEGGTCGQNTNTGTYSILNDGTGTMSFGNSTASFNFAITLLSTSKVYLISTDVANSAGIGELQSSTAIPSGTYAVRFHNVITPAGSEGKVGVFTVAGGSITGGAVDVNLGGIVDGGTGNPFSVTGGSFSTPSSTGRGTGSISDSSGATASFIYYVVDANNIRFLSSDSGVTGSGRAEMQTGGPFTAASLANGYAFASRGDDDSSIAIGTVTTVGSFVSNSTGTITGGTYDSVVDGNSFYNISFSGGSYTMSSNGRAPITLNISTGGSFQHLFWMVNPTRAFFLTSLDPADTLSVEDGVATQQQTSSFSNSSLNGQYAFVMHGYDLNPIPSTLVDRVGWIQWDGNGNLNLSEFISANGSTSKSPILTGTYSVSASGRATATVNNLSYNPGDIVLYLISPTDAYMLENDPDVQIIGATSKQISP